MRPRDYDPGVQGLELHVRADGDVLVFHVVDRERASPAIPIGSASLGRTRAVSRGARLHRLIADACARGALSAADRESMRGQAQLLHDLLVPAALRPVLRSALGGTLWLRLRGWSTELPWEWLHDGTGYWFARFGLGRDGGDAPRSPTRPSPPRSVVVLGDFSTLAGVRIDRIEAALLEGGVRARVHRGPLLREDLRVALRAADIVHVGADADEHGLRCADGSFGSPELQARPGSWPQMLVLSGSSTRGVAEAARRAGVGVVIAMNTPVPTGAASSVAEALYASLLRGACIAEALRAGRCADPEHAGAVPWLLLGDPGTTLSPPGVAAAPGAWLAVWIGVGPSALAEIVREEGRRVGLEAQPSRSGGASLFHLDPARFGDRFGEAGLCFAELLRDLLPPPRVQALGGRPGAALGFALAVGSGAPERAIELARRAAPDVLIVDRDAKESSRQERRIFIELRRAGTDGATVWEVRAGSRVPPGPVLGRRDELQALQRTFDQVQSALGTRVALITGDAGSGKSALARGFGHRIVDQQVEVQTLERSEFAGPEGHYEPDSETATVLVYEDAHRLDDAQLDGLVARLQAPRSRPCLLVVTLRADTPRRQRLLARLEQISHLTVALAPLSPGDASAVARQLMGRAGLSREEERTLALADGNPMLIRLLASRLTEGGPSGVEPPALVRAMLADRLAGAGEEVARVLEGVAVLGPPCTADALEALPGVSSGAIGRAASEGWLTLRSEMVGGRRQARCSLRDPMMARHLDGLIDAVRGPELHQAALEWHRATGGPASVLARHALRSPEPLQAVAPLWESVRGGGIDDRHGALVQELERLLATTPEPEMPLDAPTAAQVRAVRSGPPTAPPLGDGLSIRGLIGVGRLATRFLGDGPEGELELRIVHPELAPDRVAQERLDRDLRRLRALGLAGVVSSGDLRRIDGQLVVPARSFSGVTARAALRVMGAGLSPVLAAAVASRAAGLLAALTLRAPDAVSPLDLRPGGIWLGLDGGVRVEHLTVLQGRPLPILTELGALRGRVGYVAPELLEGHETPANAVWSLGVVLWELLTGEPLFQGPSIRFVSSAVRHVDLTAAMARIEAIRPELGLVLRRVLVRDPGRRPSPAVLAAELAGLSGDPGRGGSAEVAELARLVATSRG